MNESFRLLGACVATHLNIHRVVKRGTRFAVKVIEDRDKKWVNVLAVDSEENRIGFFPPEVRAEYLRMPNDKRYRYVEVKKEVDLYDKYGVCKVVPVYGR